MEAVREGLQVRLCRKILSWDLLEIFEVHGKLGCVQIDGCGCGLIAAPVSVET